MDPIQEEIQNGLKEAFKGVNVDNTGAGFENVNDQIAEKHEAKPEIIDSSLNSENKTTETKPVESTTETKPVESTTETTTETVPAKSFEELLAEKSAGKFKSWEEIEAIANKPNDEFANDDVKNWNELVKKGVKLDAEFFELQSKDFGKMDDPLEIRMEAMKRQPEFEGLSPKTIELQLDKKYNLSEWINKDEEDYTDEDRANQEILVRDAWKDREWLVNFKNERIFAKEPDPNQEKQRVEAESLAQENWERFVDEELANKTQKLSTKIDDKESVDFEVSDADRKYAADMMKSMTKDIKVFWDQFADKDGKINQKAVYEMILFNKNRDNIIKVAHQNAIAKGKESEIKAIKNTAFEPNATQASQKVDWRIKAQQEIEKNL